MPPVEPITKPPIGYVAADPSEPMPISLRQQMRGDVCGHCGAKVLLHAAGYREAKKQFGLLGETLKIICPACDAIDKAERPNRSPGAIFIPPAVDTNQN